MRYNQIFLTDSRINISSHNKILSLQFTGGIYVIGSDQVYYQVLLFYILYFIFSKNFFEWCHNKLEFLQCTSVTRCHGGQGGGGDVLKTFLGPTLTAD